MLEKDFVPSGLINLSFDKLRGACHSSMVSSSISVTDSVVGEFSDKAAFLSRSDANDNEHRGGKGGNGRISLLLSFLALLFLFLGCVDR